MSEGKNIPNIEEQTQPALTRIACFSHLLTFLSSGHCELQQRHTAWDTPVSPHTLMGVVGIPGSHTPLPHPCLTCPCCRASGPENSPLLILCMEEHSCSVFLSLSFL